MKTSLSSSTHESSSSRNLMTSPAQLISLRQNPSPGSAAAAPESSSDADADADAGRGSSMSTRKRRRWRKLRNDWRADMPRFSNLLSCRTCLTYVLGILATVELLLLTL